MTLVLFHIKSALFMMWPTLLPVILVTMMLYRCSGASFKADVNPANLTVGFTDTMTVSCSFTRDNPPTIVKPLSIVLAKSRDTDKHFHDVATVSVFHNRPIINKLDEITEIDGDIQVNGTSFLKIKWTLPTSEESGVYKCTLTGQDRSENVVKEIKIVNVRETLPTALDFLAMQKKLQATLKCLSRLEEKDVEIENKVSTFNETLNTKANVVLNSLLSDKLIDVKKDVMTNVNQSLSIIEESLQFINESNNIITSNIRWTKEMMFSKQFSFRNSTYYLSRFGIHRMTIGQTACAMFGGYVVEINDVEEYNAIV